MSSYYSKLSNGFNLIGFGAESALMGGADLAVARDTSALNTNPAGLAQIQNRAFDLYLAAAYTLDVAHADRIGNNSRVVTSCCQRAASAMRGGFADCR